MSEVPIKLKQKHVLIAGTDEYQIKLRGEELVKALAPEDPMNLEVLDGRADTVDDARTKIGFLREALLTMPFFGGGKLVFLKNCNFLADSVIGKSESVLEALAGIAEILSGLGTDSVQLLITAQAVDKRRVFYKNFEKFGYCESHDLPELKNARDIENWMLQIERMMKDKGVVPGPGVVERMVELMGNDSRALHNEIEKLSLYAMPGGEVHEEDLKKIVSSTRELLVWDLCDAVTECNVSESLHILRQLMAQGESEVGILILLSGQIRLAALGTHLLESKKMNLRRNGAFLNATLAPGAEDLLPKNKKGDKPNLFRMARVVDKAKRHSSGRWYQALETLYHTNLALVSSGSDRQKILETAVLKICHS